MILVLIMAIGATLRPYIIKKIFDLFPNIEFNNLAFLVFIYACVHLTVVVAYALNDFYLTKYCAEYRANIVEVFIDKVNHYSYNFFLNNMPGSIVAKVSEIFNNVPHTIVFTVISDFLYFFLVALIACIMIFQIDKYVAICVVIWIFIFLYNSYYFYKRANILNDSYAITRPKIYGFLSDFVSNILSVWFFNGIEHEKTTLKLATDDFKEKALTYGKFLCSFYIVQGVSLVIYMVITLLLLGKSSGNITAGDFAQVILLNYTVSDLLFSVSYKFRGFHTILGLVKDSIKIFDCPTYFQETIPPKNKKLESVKGKIIFHHVTFQYQNNTYLFKNISVTINAGEIIGLVGYSGGGKTSFINLIARLYDIDSGKILIDDIDIKDMDLISLRNNLALISQEPLLFNRSLADNIKYGTFGATEEDIIKVAQKVKLHDFIIKQPESYNTLVGDRGVKLSGGQRQRIFIARALLKDASILLIDEGTSQLDSITEKDIYDSIWDLTKTQFKTTIIVAHRLSTLLNVNRILVFDNGEIVEDGSHQELLKKGGLYKKLWDSQILGFLPLAK